MSGIIHRVFMDGIEISRKPFVPAEPPEPKRKGPGTHLKRMLSRFGFTAGGGCRCDAHAARMDAAGPDWCEENITEIVGWLREEAKKRGIIFLPSIARILITRAISLARRSVDNPS